MQSFTDKFFVSTSKGWHASTNPAYVPIECAFLCVCIYIGLLVCMQLYRPLVCMNIVHALI